MDGAPEMGRNTSDAGSVGHVADAASIEADQKLDIEHAQLQRKGPWERVNKSMRTTEPPSADCLTVFRQAVANDITNVDFKTLLPRGLQ